MREWRTEGTTFFCDPHRARTLVAQYRFLPALAHARRVSLAALRARSLRWVVLVDDDSMINVKALDEKLAGLDHTQPPVSVCAPRPHQTKPGALSSNAHRPSVREPCTFTRARSQRRTAREEGRLFAATTTPPFSLFSSLHTVCGALHAADAFSSHPRPSLSRPSHSVAISRRAPRRLDGLLCVRRLGLHLLTARRAPVRLVPAPRDSNRGCVMGTRRHRLNPTTRARTPVRQWQVRAPAASRLLPVRLDARAVRD
eukprot:7379268-Prymnesium_polylepis.2